MQITNPRIEFTRPPQEFPWPGVAHPWKLVADIDGIPTTLRLYAYPPTANDVRTDYSMWCAGFRHAATLLTSTTIQELYVPPDSDHCPVRYPTASPPVTPGMRTRESE